MKNERNIIITIPAYNEEKTLGPVIQEIRNAMKETPYQYQILVLDDGSTDKTVEVAKRNGAIVASHQRNLGLADTFRDEMIE